MSVHWGGKGPGHVSRWPRGVGAMSPYSGATMLLDFLNPVLDPRITFSRGTNATLIDSTGKLTYAPANLLLNSEGTVAQLNASGNVTDAAPTISGFANSIQFGDNSVTRFAYKTLTISGGVPLIASFFVQMDDNSAPVVGTGTTGGDLAIIIDGSYAPTVSVSPVSGNIYRVSGLLAAPTGGGFRNVGIIKNTGQSAKGFRVTGFQLEQITYQTTPSTYVATTASAYYGPRFDYDPVTLAPRGLLIEEARTNLLTYSEAISTGYVPVRATLVNNATSAPSGVVNATKLVEDTTAGSTHIVGGTITAGATSSFSVFAKAAERTWLYVVSGTATAYFDLSTGAVGTTANCTGSTVNMGNGWYRCIISNFTTSSSVYVGPATGNGGASYTGNGTSGLYLWGLQLEAGGFATSYIPTVASTVTRNADVATMTGTNFSSWYNQSEGTFVGVGSINVATANSGSAGTASDGTNNNRVLIGFEPSVQGFVAVGGAAQASLLGGAAAANVVNRVAFATKANDFALTLNGATVVTDVSGTMPTVDRFNIGANGLGSGSFLNGHIRTIAYFNTRLPNAQLQTLTAPSLATTLSLDFTTGSYNVGF